MTPESADNSFQPPSPDRSLIAACVGELAAYRQQNPPVDSAEVAWMIAVENEDMAEFVRSQMAQAAIEADQMMIAATAWVVWQAIRRALTKEAGRRRALRRMPRRRATRELFCRENYDACRDHDRP